MKYAPSVWDFQNNFFLVERTKEPYFLLARNGKVLRSNRVGGRLLAYLSKRQPQRLKELAAEMNALLEKSTAKAATFLLGTGARKRVLRAVPIDSGAGYLVEIDRV